MSIDYTVICNKCHDYHHLGQCMAGNHSFGYSYDDITTQQSVGEFIINHMTHELNIVGTDNIPKDFINKE